MVWQYGIVTQTKGELLIDEKVWVIKKKKRKDGRARGFQGEGWFTVKDLAAAAH